MSRILSVDDDDVVLHEIQSSLTPSGHDIDVARTGRDGIARVMAGDYDVVTLDRMLPDVDGLSVLGVMREVGIDTPVLVLSSLSDLDERVRGLRAGGDDYLSKPFSPEEMAARIDALLRRRTADTAAPMTLRIGPLELDVVRRTSRIHDAAITLSPTEFRVLEFMVRHANQMLTRTMLFEGVWGYRFDPGTNLIDVHVGKLRTKLTRATHDLTIRTVRGAGYMLSS